MTTVAWWNCFAGIAGDMALGSLIDAGADFDEVVAGLEGLPVTGWHIEVAKTSRAGLAATQLRVDVDPSSDRTERTWGTIRAVIDRAPGLAGRARTRAQGVFSRLAAAEGRLHGLPPRRSTSMRSVASTRSSMSWAHAWRWSPSGSVRYGQARSLSALARCAGPMDRTACCPTQLPLSSSSFAGAPVRGTAREEELTTPTGAALLAGLAESFGPVPQMKITKQRLRCWHP